MLSASIFFPPVKKEMTPLEIAETERAIWQMEAMNALLEASSLPPLDAGRYVKSDAADLALSDSMVEIDLNEDPPSPPSVHERDMDLAGFPFVPPAVSLCDPGPGLPPLSVLTQSAVESALTTGNVPPTREASLSDNEEYSCFEAVRIKYLRPPPLQPKDLNIGTVPCVPRPEVTYRPAKNNKENAIPKQVRRKPVPQYRHELPRKYSPSPAQWLGSGRTGLAPAPRGRTLTPTPKITSLALSSFSLKHVLGSGAQGKVYLVKHQSSPTGKLYAMKVIDKRYLRRQVDLDLIQQEQRVMKKLRGHPFILNLEASFNDSSYFYLVMDYHGGGDLHQVLFMHRTFSVDTTRFYLAEMAQGLDYLHSQGIIHQDIKLANTILKSDGHIVLADFGLVRDLSSPLIEVDEEKSIYSLRGTVTHMAPEVLGYLPFDQKIDIWALGICEYTMLTGHVPWFEPSDDNETIRAIMEDSVPIEENCCVDHAAKNLLEQLLEKDPASRLGMSDLLSHPFFTQINWSDLKQLKIKPPFIPIDNGEFLATGTLPNHQRFIPGLTAPYYKDPHEDYYFAAPELFNNTPEDHPATTKAILRETQACKPRPVADVPLPATEAPSLVAEVPLSIAMEFGVTKRSEISLSISTTNLQSDPSASAVHSSTQETGTPEQPPQPNSTRTAVLPDAILELELPPSASTPSPGEDKLSNSFTPSTHKGGSLPEHNPQPQQPQTNAPDLGVEETLVPPSDIDSNVDVQTSHEKLPKIFKWVIGIGRRLFDAFSRCARYERT